jgi:hypothetical protein
MSRLGEYNSNLAANIIAANGYDEISSPVTTTAAALEDITGLTFDLVVPTGLPSTARIVATMAVQCSSSGGSGGAGGWAVGINSADKQEIQRYLSAINDTGALIVLGSTAGLAAGTYTVKGRHRRVSGTGTISTDVAQLSAIVVME